MNVNKFSKICIQKYEDTQNFNISCCPNCNSSNLIKWGTYNRNIIYFKNKKKCEETIQIKRIRCNKCGKTQSIIPNFIVPYKVHAIEYINNVIKFNIIRNTNYNKISEKYNISRQLIKYWLDCFDDHYTRISVTLEESNHKKIIKQISKSIYNFIYNYYRKNNMIYMMYVYNFHNKPILKWAPT